MKIAIDYSEPLLFGLHSPAGSEGRLFQNLALCMSEYGHEVDIYVPQVGDIKETYPNIRFKELSSKPDTGYDFYFPTVWCIDTADTSRARTTVYLSYHKIWETARPNHLSLLRQDNVVLGYISKAYWPNYFDSSEFTGKTLYMPKPLYRSFSDTMNFDKPYWAISDRGVHSWWTKEEQASVTNGCTFVEQLAKKLGIPMIEFPVNCDYNTVYNTMKDVSMLFPMHQHGSSLEAIISGTLPFPIEHNKQYGLLKEATKATGMYLEQPFDTAELERLVMCALDKDFYIDAINTYRSYLTDNRFDVSARIITEALEKI